MADIKNKNELKRRIELFMDELDYSINEKFCMETMRMMREFIGHASHRLDCADSKIKGMTAKLKEYQKLDKQGLLQPIECHCKDCVHWSDMVAGATEHVKLCTVGGYMVGENGYCVYAEQALKQMESEVNTNG